MPGGGRLRAARCRRSTPRRSSRGERSRGGARRRGRGQLPLAASIAAPGALRPRRARRRDCARSSSAPATRGGEWTRLGRDRRRRPGLLRRRRRAPAPQPAAGARRGRCTTSTSPGRRATLGGAADRVRAGDQLGLHLGRGAARARGRRRCRRGPAIVTRGDWGAEPSEGGCKPRAPAELRHGQGRRRPSHGDRERLHARPRRRRSCSGSAAITATATAGTTSATTRSSTASATSTRAAPAACARPSSAPTRRASTRRPPASPSIGTHTTTADHAGERRRRWSTTWPGSSPCTACARPARRR